MPLSTGVVGVNAAGRAFTYDPPNVVAVPVGSTVTYGAWVTIQAGDSLPNPGVFEVQAGSAPVVPGNLGLYRTVTITPLTS